jgi:hypothetical protein
VRIAKAERRLYALRPLLFALAFSALEVSVPTQSGLEDIHDLAALGGGDAFGGHGVFGEVAEAGDHVLRLVFDVGEHFGDAVAFEFAVFDLAVLDVDGDDVGAELGKKCIN